MKQVRITVLKTTLDRELAAEYGVEGLGACPVSYTHLDVYKRQALFWFGDGINPPNRQSTPAAPN